MFSGEPSTAVSPPNMQHERVETLRTFRPESADSIAQVPQKSGVELTRADDQLAPRNSIEDSQTIFAVHRDADIVDLCRSTASASAMRKLLEQEGLLGAALCRRVYRLNEPVPLVDLELAADPYSSATQINQVTKYVFVYVYICEVGFRVRGNLNVVSYFGPASRNGDL